MKAKVPLEELHKRVIDVARENPPSDHVPYAFEKRVMSRLAGVSAPNFWALWAGPLWRAALSCVAITLVCGWWSLNSTRSVDTQENFSQAFEAAVLAPPNTPAEDAW